MTNRKTSKKPISRATQHLIESCKQKRETRSLHKRFLIVCEDGKSAPNYFFALKKHFNIEASFVTVFGSGGRTQPIQVVNYAAELKSLAMDPESTTEPYEEVWCVIDGDYGDKITSAREFATANDIKVAVSNPCFEYWILLHFERYDQSFYKCQSVVIRLRSRHIKEYKKGKFDFGSIVSKSWDAAILAEIRKPGAARGDLPEIQNPSDEIYKLIKSLFNNW